MSMPNETIITCPSCGNEQKFTIWNSVNVSLAPDLKKNIISGELVSFSCDKCGDKSRVVYPMLYHDMDLNLMIWLFPGDNPPKDDTRKTLDHLKGIGDGYQYRWVQSFNDLIEKINIYDAGMDDRVIEWFKSILHHKWKDEMADSDMILFVECVDNEKEKSLRFEIVSTNGCRGYAIDMEDFEHLCESIGDDDLEKIFPLDADWPSVCYRSR